MRGGYVLDLSNATFADFLRTSIGFDPYGKYGEGHSKARLLRLIWEQEADAAVAKLNLDLLGRGRVSKLIANEVPSAAQESLRQELAQHFAQQTETESGPATSAAAPVSFTTEASVTANKIEIEIREDIYGHIGVLPDDRRLLPCCRGVLQARAREASRDYRQREGVGCLQQQRAEHGPLQGSIRQSRACERG